MHARHFVPSSFLVALLSGCAGTVALQPAELANDPGCADVMVRVPDAIGANTRRTTNAQSTAAWGDPTAIILRCGIPDSGPSTLPCYTVNGIDWLRDDSKDPSFVFTTYGRTPATEVIVDSTKAGGTDALAAVGTAVGSIPATAKCLDSEDVFGN